MSFAIPRPKELGLSEKEKRVNQKIVSTVCMMLVHMDLLIIPNYLCD